MVNWKAIKAEYLAGGTSYRKLAAKHGVSFNTLQDRAKREAWGDAARQVHDKVTTELPVRIAEAVIENHLAIAKEHFALWAQGIKLAEDAMYAKKAIATKDGGILEVPFIESAKDLASWASAVKHITEGQRLAAGMKDPNKRDANGSIIEDEAHETGVLLLPMKDEDPVDPLDANAPPSLP